MSPHCPSFSLPPRPRSFQSVSSTDVPLIFPYPLECCVKYPKMKPDRWPSKLDSHGSKPRPNPTPMSPLYSIYVSRRSKSRCTRSAPPMQVAQLQMVPRTRRSQRIRVIASLCERKSSVTIPTKHHSLRLLTRSPFVLPQMGDPIPPQPLCSPWIYSSQLLPVRPVCTASCAPLAGYPAYGSARIFCWMLCKSCALSPAGTHPCSWPSIPY